MKTSVSSIVSKPWRIPQSRALVTATLVATMAFAVQAANIEWQGGTASYTTAANWAGGTVPGANDNAINDNGTNNAVQINVGNPDWTLNQILAGNGAGNGAFEQNGQTVILNDYFSSFHLGSAAGDTGIYTLNGGTINCTNGGQLYVGQLGSGILNINGGLITSSGNFAVNMGMGTSPNAVTASMDGGVNKTGYTWSEQGADAANTAMGLPTHGSTFTTNVLGQDHTYTMAASYTANDAVMVGSNEATSATITLTSPTACSALSFLGSAGNGPVTLNYTVHHADNTMETGSITVLDWFDNTGTIAFGAGGRVAADGSSIGDYGLNNNPYLDAMDISLTNTSSAVTSIDLTLASAANGGVACLLAVSSSTGAAFSPLSISGYNEDVIVEAGAISTVSDTVTDLVYQTNGAVNITGGGQFFVGNIGKGIYNLSGGSVDVHNYIAIGRSSGNGTLNMSGGSFNQDGGGNLLVGTGYNNNGNTCVGVLNQSGGTINSQGQFLCPENSPASGTYNFTGGTNNCSNWFVIGRQGGTGMMNLSNNATINKTGGGDFIVCDGDNTIGTVNMGPGTTFNVASGWFRVCNGNNSQSTFNQNGGTVIVGNGQFLVPDHGNQSPSATYTMSGDASLTVNNWLAIGRGGGQGVFNLNSGSIMRTIAADGGSHFDVGAGGPGILNQNGGSITNTANDFWLGESAAGTWNMNGGVAILGNLVLCVNSTASGIMNLNGGLLRVNGISVGNASVAVSEWFFNGGTLQASSDNLNFMSGITVAGISAGGAVIDSQGYNIAIPQELDDNGGGGLTKLGSGTLTLSGPNTYTGSTVVSNGTLIVQTPSSANGNYTVADGAGFGVTVASVNAQLTMANLTAGSSTGATLDFDLGNFGNPSSAPMNVSGTFTRNGTITVNIADAQPQLGNLPLVHYGTLAGSGNFVIGSLPNGMTATIVTNVGNNSIDLSITGVNQPRWDGQAGGTWDLGSDTNWVNIGTGLPTTYTDGSPVVFNDSAQGTTNVNVTTTVKPSSVTVDNSSRNYNFTGVGTIGGSTGLSKSGSGTLSITTANTYTGPTVISGGTLSVASLANGGLPSPIGASSASPTNLVINNATFQYTGAPATANRGFEVANTNSAIDAEGNLTLSGQVAASSSQNSAFIKTGPGQLGITSVGNNEFAFGYNPGLQVVAGTLLLDGSAGNQTNHTVNDMYVGDTPGSGASLMLSNTTLNVDGWFALGRINGGVNNVSSATLYNSTLNVGHLSVGWDGGQSGNLATQFLTMNGNSKLNDNAEVNLCEGTGSTLTMNINDTSVLTVHNPVYIALASGSTSTVVVANSGQIMQTSGWFDVGQGNDSVGTLTVKNSGTVPLLGDLNLGDTGTGTTSSLTAQDSAQITANRFFIAKGPTNSATVNITGSATISCTNYVDIAAGSGSTATVNIGSVSQPGGSLTEQGDLTVGDLGTGVLNMVTNGSGTLTVHGTMYLSRGSSNAFGSVNLNAGSTIVAGYINNGWGFGNGLSNNPNAFNFNGGTLKANVGSPYFIQPYVNAVVQAGGAVIDDGGYSITVLAALLDGGGGGGLTKLGSGTLQLDANNTYTGSTLVSAGTLAGIGSVASPVTVASGAALAAGDGSIGTFTINNTLTFSAGSAAFMQITPTNNDQIAGLTGVSYSGSLVVTNISGTSLTPGSTFQLFSSASAGTGNFTSVTILPSGSGTFDPSTGVLTITSGSAVTFNPPVVLNGNLILTGNGGAAPGSGYTLLTTTNVATPLANWTTNTTGTLDGSGMFSNSIPISASEKVRFFDVRVP